MDKKLWKEKITKACNDAGTYQDYFDAIIDTLAQIMEERDIAHDKWIEEGSLPTIIHTNRAGEANSTKNPLLTLENELNSQALAHWKELGLSPVGLKKLKADVLQQNETSFETLLNNIENG